MIITLKDGSKKEYSEAKSVIDVAFDISEGLARAACAGEVDGEVVDLRTVLDKQCSRSFWSMYLMATYRHQIDTHPFRVNVIFAKCLNRIHMKERLRILFFDNLCDLLNRLYCTYLIIYIHNRYKDRILVHFLF